MTDCRKPPLPETFLTYRSSEHAGLCKFCRDPLPKKGEEGYHHNRMWHVDCTDRYNFLTNPAYQRWQVYARDKGVCACCGYDSPGAAEFIRGLEPQSLLSSVAYSSWHQRIDAAGKWHLDHIVPLWQGIGLPDEERIKLFEIENMQTLCPYCHKEKTKREAAERAAARKEAA